MLVRFSYYCGMDTQSSVSDIIDRLGGTFKTAELCDVAPPSVSEWRANNRIPKARLMFLRLARPDVFRDDPCETSSDRAAA